MATNIVTVNSNNYQTLKEKRCGYPLCASHAFELDEKIVITGNHSRLRYYHKTCFVRSNEDKVAKGANNR